MIYEPRNKHIAFVLPESFSKAEVTMSCNTELFDPKNFIRLNVKPGDSSRYLVSTEKLSKGIWKVFLDWSDWEHWYHEEMEIVVK